MVGCDLLLFTYLRYLVEIRIDRKTSGGKQIHFLVRAYRTPDSRRIASQRFARARDTGIISSS